LSDALGCILAGFDGVEAPDWLRRRVADGLGGVVLFARNVESPEQVARLTAALRAERPDLVVATDEEGGDVTRLEAARGSSYPGNYALGAVDDVALTERVARAIAGDLARTGVNVNLAPVADVNVNPDNPVIGIRSFGSDPELCARHVAAFVRGTQAVGVAACAKHFPGHGDTAVDSHLDLPVVAEVSEAALLPFREAVDAGVAAVMTAHIRVESLGPDPATVNGGVVSLLRDELGFDGLLISDALEMRAISAGLGVEEAAVRALAAGVDALCLGADVGDGDVENVQRAIVAAVRSGRLVEERVAEAASRVRACARDTVKTEGGDATGAEAARRALLVDGDVALHGAPLVVDLRPDASIAAGPRSFGLGDALRALDSGTEVVVTREPPSLDGRPLVVVVQDAHRHEWQREAVEALGGDAIVVETGIPVWRPPGARGYVATYGAGRANLEAAAERLLPIRRDGQGPAPGTGTCA
jgi:beta-N-acetylhexosaminidase